jgi:hypothetical protein
MKDTLAMSLAAVPAAVILFLAWTFGTGDFWRIF